MAPQDQMRDQVKDTPGQASTLFPPARLKALRQRARRLGRSEDLFLTDHIGDEFAARLMVTNRTFGQVLLADSLPEPLVPVVTKALPDASIDVLEDGRFDEDDLRLEPAGYDLVLAGPGLQRRNDVPGTLIQFSQALRPDGLLMAALPGEGTFEELRQTLLALELEATGGAAMRIDPFTEVRQAGALLQRAGFALPVADADQLTLRYSSLRKMLRDIRGHGASNAMDTVARPIPRKVAAELESTYRERFGGGDGRFALTVNLVYLTGWTPHESQQKPMQPGTAQHKLADFLKPADVGRAS